MPPPQSTTTGSEAVEAIRPGQAAQATTPVISLSAISWDNGAEIGVNGGMTFYFNGLTRTVNRSNGTVTIQGPMAWNQTFGVDPGTSTGDPVPVGSNNQIQVRLTGLPQAQSNCTGCFRLEITDQNGRAHQLWFRHPGQPTAFSEAQPGVWRAQIPAGVTTITKAEFVGNLPAGTNIVFGGMDLIRAR